MGCGSSNSVKVIPNENCESKENAENSKIENGNQKYPPPEAFEIPLDEETENSLIKKHPPKRLQRLIETANVMPPSTTTLEDLETKLANAEIRRNNFLNQGVNKLKEETESNEDNETNEQEDIGQEKKTSNQQNESELENQDNVENNR